MIAQVHKKYSIVNIFVKIHDRFSYAIFLSLLG